MKESYLASDFRKTAARHFPAQAAQLNAMFDARLNALLAENANESKEKRQHLRRQILPGIAAYETLLTVMPQDEALLTVHGYLEQYAGRAHRPAAYSGAVPVSPRRVRQVDADSLWLCGGLCRDRDQSRQDHMAHRHDEVPI